MQINEHLLQGALHPIFDNDICQMCKLSPAAGSSTYAPFESVVVTRVFVQSTPFAQLSIQKPILHIRPDGEEECRGRKSYDRSPSNAVQWPI